MAWTSFQVDGFRCFEHLRLDALARVNLVCGKNNVGKTALLEALFLYVWNKAGPGFDREVLRGEGPLPLGDPRERLSLWFWKQESPRTVTLEAWRDGATQGRWTLTDAQAARAPTTNVVRTMVGDQVLTLNPILSLAFSADHDAASATVSAGSARLPNGQLVQQYQTHFATPIPPPVSFGILPATASLSEVPRLFSQAVEAGQKAKLVDILRSTIEPRIRAIDLIDKGQGPLLVADVGLPRPIPLPLMGEGMTRILFAVVAILGCRGGVLLADEIENGIHHTVLPKLWRVIREVAQQEDVQVFATTHSWECIQAAFDEAAEACALYRLEGSVGGVRGVRYDHEAFSGAMMADFEVR